MHSQASLKGPRMGDYVRGPFLCTEFGRCKRVVHGRHLRMPQSREQMEQTMVDAFANLIAAVAALFLKAVAIVLAVWLAAWFAAYMPWPEVPTYAQKTLCPNSWR